MEFLLHYFFRTSVAFCFEVFDRNSTLFWTRNNYNLHPFMLSWTHEKHIAKTILIISLPLFQSEGDLKSNSMCAVQSFVINLKSLEGVLMAEKHLFLMLAQVDKRLHLQSTIFCAAVIKQIGLNARKLREDRVKSLVAFPFFLRQSHKTFRLSTDFIYC